MTVLTISIDGREVPVPDGARGVRLLGGFALVAEDAGREPLESYWLGKDAAVRVEVTTTKEDEDGEAA